MNKRYVFHVKNLSRCCIFNSNNKQLKFDKFILFIQVFKNTKKKQGSNIIFLLIANR